MTVKTYRVEEIVFTELSRNKGSIEYYLIDSIKNKRKVTGIAKLGFSRKIKSVKAVYQREKPLIDALIQADVGHRITVDFTEFNKVPRINKVTHSSKESNQLDNNVLANSAKHNSGDISATMVYQDYYNDMSYNEKLKNNIPDMSWLGVWSVFLFMVWLVFMAISQFADMVK